MSVAEEAAVLALQEKLDRALEDTATVRRENARLTGRLTKSREEVDALEAVLGFTKAVEDAKPRPPRWAARKPAKGHHATLVVMLTDTHFDEVVDPGQMGGMNAYDRDIATVRLHRWHERTVMLCRDYRGDVTLDGVVVLYGGDIFSGLIHPELVRTNADELLGSVLYWEEQVLAALLGVATDTGLPVHVAATFGNHPRLTLKPWAKMEARQNFDWFLAKQLERHLDADDRFTFDVPEARDTYVQVYDTTICLNHGNETSGGGGIGGIFPPLLRMKARKAERDAALGKTWDVLAVGHWHQEIFAPQQGLIVSGAMKGYDEYARRFNFRPERPGQMAFLVTPEHKITDGRPILVGDRKAEGW